MSITSPEADELFTVRVYKKVDIAADQMWANTYELQAAVGASAANLVTAAQAIVEFEKTIHQDTVFFDRVVVSTWVDDGVAYDPESFTTIPLTGAGLVASPVAAEVLPLQVALFVRRDTLSGRTGKVFYRGCLGEDDVSGRFGTIALTNAAAIQTRVDNAVTGSGLDALLPGGGESAYRLVMAARIGGVLRTRAVQGLTAAGVKLIKYNNRYFDRA